MTFENGFVLELAEMASPWQAQEAPDPQLLVLIESVDTELGPCPAWLRSSEGVRLLTGRFLRSGAAPVAQAYAGHQSAGTPHPWAMDGRSCSVSSSSAMRRRVLPAISRGRTLASIALA